MVLVREPLILNPDNSNIAVQIGRSVTSFIVKRNWKILSVCLGYTQIFLKKIIILIIFNFNYFYQEQMCQMSKLKKVLSRVGLLK